MQSPGDSISIDVDAVTVMEHGYDGYDEELVVELDSRLRCHICLFIMRSAVQTFCGHRFCEACIMRVGPIVGGSAVLTCPVDRTILKVDEIFPDIAIRREILCLPIKCTNSTEGCTWLGKLIEMPEHQSTCGFERVPCTHGCGTRIRRSEIDQHMTQCPSRQETITGGALANRSDNRDSTVTVMEHGYDEEFVVELDSRLRCHICLFIMRSAVQTFCGHRFCEACIMRVGPIVGVSAVLTCPVDRTILKVDEIFPDVAIRREILCLPIKCTNSTEGCTWLGELIEMPEHQSTCGFERVPCTHGCGTRIRRSEIDQHMTQCPSRQETITGGALANRSDNRDSTVASCETRQPRPQRVLWTREEEQRLVQLVQLYGKKNVQKITEELSSNRTVKSVAMKIKRMNI